MGLCYGKTNDRETILVGFTTMTDKEINQVIQTLSKEFTGAESSTFSGPFKHWEDYVGYSGH